MGRENQGRVRQTVLEMEMKKKNLRKFLNQRQGKAKCRLVEGRNIFSRRS